MSSLSRRRKISPLNEKVDSSGLRPFRMTEWAVCSQNDEKNGAPKGDEKCCIT